MTDNPTQPSSKEAPQGASKEPTDPPEGTEGGTEETPTQTFTQADVDRIVRERVKRERDKYADYADLQAKAKETATAEERIASLEQALVTTQTEALKRRIQAAHNITDVDADLFLTGTDEETLTAQAQRLNERESERLKKGNHVPLEGKVTRPPAANEKAAFANFLAGKTS